MRAGIVLVVGLVAPASLAAADLDEIKRRGVLRVAAVPISSSPFFHSVEGDSPQGFDRDILDGFARAQGVRLEVVAPPKVDDLIPYLQQGRVDLIAGGFTRTEARARLVDFTSEVLPQRHLVLTRKPRAPVRTLQQLRAERRVGTVKGTSWAEAVAAAGVPRPSVDDEIALSPAAIAEALRSSRVTAAVVGVVFAALVVKADPDVQLGLVLGEPGSSAYAVRRTSPALRAALSAHLEALKRTPSWYDLLIKHFGAAAPEILKRTRGE